MRLENDFFENKSTLEIAKYLLGKTLVYETEQGILKGIISETEAYTQEDPASHTFNGKKAKRNETMFKNAGHLYVYFTYGMHYCANIVTGREGVGEAVLIRAVIPISGTDLMIKNRKGNVKNIADGPSKLCQAYGFNRIHNGIDMFKEQSKIYLEDTGKKPLEIFQTERIGISNGKELPWRFVGKFQ